jgi:hypothetical protein
MKTVVDYFDTSDYHADSVYRISFVNKKVIVTLKHVVNRSIMQEFFGLRTEMYAFRVSNKEKKKANGVKECVIDKEVTFSDYKECLLHQQEMYNKILSVAMGIIFTRSR